MYVHQLRRRAAVVDTSDSQRQSNMDSQSLLVTQTIDGGSFCDDQECQPEAAAEDTVSERFQRGDIVEVAKRTWVGINRPGGTARITAVHEGKSPAIYLIISENDIIFIC